MLVGLREKALARVIGLDGNGLKDRADASISDVPGSSHSKGELARRRGEGSVCGIAYLREQMQEI